MLKFVENVLLIGGMIQIEKFIFIFLSLFVFILCKPPTPTLHSDFFYNLIQELFMRNSKPVCSAIVILGQVFKIYGLK